MVKVRFFSILEKMAACKNCFLFDEIKLHSKVGFFKTRRDMVLFILNVLLNIKDLFMNNCKCDGENICQPCNMAEVFDEKTVYKIYKNCLNLDFLLKVQENLHLHMCTLYEKKDHFLCQIINEKFHYHHKCMFTGTNLYVDVSVAYSEWGKIKIEEISKKEAKVFASNYFKENPFFKV